jgi:hypothetical protein
MASGLLLLQHLSIKNHFFQPEAEEHGYASILPAPAIFEPIFRQKNLDQHHLPSSLPQMLGLASPYTTVNSTTQERRLIKQNNRKPQGNR